MTLADAAAYALAFGRGVAHVRSPGLRLQPELVDGRVLFHVIGTVFVAPLAIESFTNRDDPGWVIIPIPA